MAILQLCVLFPASTLFNPQIVGILVILNFWLHFWFESRERPMRFGFIRILNVPICRIRNDPEMRMI